MDPLEQYSKIQPLVVNDIKSAFDTFTSERQYDVAKIPAHVHTGVDSNRVSFSDLTNRKRFIICRLLASTTDTTVANLVGGDFVMPFSGYIYEVGATVDTAGVTGTTDIDINKNGTTVMLAKVKIDSTEKTSRTGATSSVIDSSKVNFIVGDILTFDVDVISTTAAKGLTMFVDVVET